MAASELSQIAKSVSSFGSTANQFRQSASQHNESVKKILKDVHSVFKSQSQNISNLSDSIQDALSESQDQVTGKINSTNSLLENSIQVQNMMLQQLGMMSNVLKQIAQNTQWAAMNGSGQGGIGGMLGGSMLDIANRNMGTYGKGKNGIGMFGKAAAGLGIAAFAGYAGYKVMGGDGGFAGSAGEGPGGSEGEGPGGSGGSATPAGQNGSSSEAMQYFTSKGWTKEQAAGIVGNLQHESGNFAADVLSGKRKGDGGKAVGLAQWHPDRQQRFKQVIGKDVIGSTFKDQLEFVQWELSNSHKSAGNKLAQAKTAQEAADVINKHYEISKNRNNPGAADNKQRIANAVSLAGGGNQASATPNVASNAPAQSAAATGAPPATGAALAVAPTAAAAAAAGSTGAQGGVQQTSTPQTGNQLGAAAQTSTESGDQTESEGRDQGGEQTGAPGVTSSGNAAGILAKYNTKDSSHIQGMKPDFASKLASFLDAANQSGQKINIKSGYRSPEHQAVLWQNALKKYGSADAARKWVAPPGHSNHNKGSAADLEYSSDSAKQWAHQNASKFGLNFRMGHEPWHIEPAGGQGGERMAGNELGNIGQMGAGQMGHGALGQMMMGGGMPIEGRNLNTMGMGGMGMGGGNPFEMMGGMLGGGKGAAIGSLVGMGASLLGKLFGGQQQMGEDGEEQEQATMVPPSQSRASNINQNAAQQAAIAARAAEQGAKPPQRQEVAATEGGQSQQVGTGMRPEDASFFGNNLDASWFEKLKQAYPHDLTNVKFA
jgi:LAS superfamily LD-carboxypeptidase LdcB